MIERIVEIAEDNRHLSLYRGFLMVHETGPQRREVGRVPLEDIGAVIAHSHGLSYSNNVLVALAEKGAPFVLCGSHHNVVGMLWPVDGNFQQAKRMDAQLAATKPLQKQLWASIVRIKLLQQAAVLDASGKPSKPLTALANKVRSGDIGNLEAQGARRYWKLLMGESFRRDTAGGGINSLLNYGYTVYRAATARAVVAAGLHPTLGIHHSNEGNPMRLVDDLIEPFRPLVDWQVFRLVHADPEVALTAECKRTLAMSLYQDLQTVAGATPVMVCMQRLAVSLAQSYLTKLCDLAFPMPGVSLDA
ncbi:Conserved hypothetical protein [gamma proteobacterium HdN1]|nr:Conserved hypothetical protein [gamma proteobacterium HdN1]